MRRHIRHIIAGFAGGLFLLVLYFGILSLVNSFSHAWQQFSQMWYWILVLAVGFGVQVGFYSCIRKMAKTAVISGGVSTGSMVLCCLHHAVDILPLIGLAAISLFLVKYQTFFIIIGIFSNFIGIAIMLRIARLVQLKKIVIGLPAVFFLIIAVGILFQPKIDKKEITFFPQTVVSQNGISFEAEPIGFAPDNPVKFKIKIDTHSGSLDFDLAKISALEDDMGNKYLPSEWQGSGSGTHHMSGNLIFPAINNQTDNIRLIINMDTQIIFKWKL